MTHRFTIKALVFGVFLLSAAFLSAVSSVEAASNPYCANGTELTYYEFMMARGSGAITVSLVADEVTRIATSTITNNTGCTFPNSLSSYMMFDQTLSGQKYYSGTVAQSYSTTSVQVIPLPNCMTQIDLWYGQAPMELLDSNPYYTEFGPSVMTWTYTHNYGGWQYAQGKFCTNEDIPPPSRLIVDKITYPSGDVTSFAVALNGTGFITGSSTGAVTDSLNQEFVVTHGTYSVTEEVPEGWTQVSSTCNDVVVGVGETKTCTIVNQKIVESVGWCSPGYWKQPHHFDSWVGYTPNQLFSSVFENAFQGKTLLQVLQLPGGKLNALGRFTVNALLNSTKLENPEYATAQVISLFNAAYPGTNADYEKLHKDFIADENCSLN